MHITEFNLRGYGIFHQCRVKGLSPGLCLFLGDNEAGKSTCLSFIRDVFFGAPDKRHKEKTYPALRGGDWGGSITLDTPQPGRILLDRGSGPRGGRLNIYGPQGGPLDADALPRLLAGTTREVYKNVYAFSLSELQTMDSLSSEGVRDAIYSAGLGTGLSSLPEVLKSLKGEKEKLFKSGGQQQEINRLVKNLEEVDKEIARASGDIQAYDRVLQELEELGEENKRRKKGLASLQARLAGLKAMRDSWDQWTERTGIIRELEELPATGDFPENGLARYEEIRRRLEELEKSRRELVLEIEDIKYRLHKLAPDGELLEREDQVRWLAEEKTRFVEAGEELARLEPEIEARREGVRAVLRRLGANWDREKIGGFDCSLKVKDGISRFKDDLHKLEKEVDRASAEAETRNGELVRAGEALKKAREELDALGPEDPAFDPDLVGKIRRDRDRFAQAAEELPVREQEKKRGLEESRRILAEINPRWSREDAEKFDTSLKIREKIEEFRKSFARGDRELLQLEQKMESARQSLDGVQEREEKAKKALQEATPGRFRSLQEVRDAASGVKEMQKKGAELNTLEVKSASLLDRLTALDRELAELPEKSGPGGTGFLLAGAGALVLSAVAFMSGLSGIFPVYARPAAAIFGLGGLVFFGVHAGKKFLFRSLAADREKRRRAIDGQRGGIEEEIKKHDREKKELEEQIRDIRERLGLSGDESLDGVENELQNSREVLQRVSHLREEKEELARQREKLTREMKSLEELRERKSAETGELRRAWNSELTGMGLDPDLDPTVAARLVDRVETVRAQINHLRGAEDRLEKLHEFMHGFASQTARACADPGLEQETSGTVLAAADNYLQKAEQEKQRLTNRQAAKKEVERLSGEYSRLQEALQQVEQDKKRAREKLEKCRTSWSRYLESIGLDPEFTPDLAREALADIERAQAIIREQTELEDKKKQYQKRRRDFISRARALSADLGREEPQESSLPAFVHKLMQDLDAARSDFASHRELSGQLRQKENALQEMDREIQEAKSGEEELLEAADVLDVQEFLRRGRILEKRQALLDKLQDLDRGLMRGTGESDMERIKELFSAWSLQGLEEEIARLKREMEEEEARHQENVQRSGELKAEKDRLASDDDLSRLQQKKESLLEDLNRASRRWCKYALVEHFLRRAREKYEKEQQPQVVRTAGRYLARITAGAYTGVFAPLGENSVYAVDTEGKSVSPEDLSRGTAEQLYLSLRVGYIHNSGRQGERLPVIMDDILVNFDPYRAENAAQAIAEMARENQVLYFTCHPQTLDVFKNAAPKAAVFEIGQGDIRRKN
jgi:uncharacterized protein YhaN